MFSYFNVFIQILVTLSPLMIDPQAMQDGKYGFTLEQFKDAADRWAKITESDEKEERAFKEYWQRNYDSAARLARESGDETVTELDRINNELIAVSRNAIRRYRLEGNSFFQHYVFREAMNAYGKIEKLYTAGTRLAEAGADDFTIKEIRAKFD